MLADGILYISTTSARVTRNSSTEALSCNNVRTNPRIRSSSVLRLANESGDRRAAVCMARTHPRFDSPNGSTVNGAEASVPP